MPSFKPTVTGIAVIFMVQDLERSARFYTETVGLPIEKNDDYLIAKLENGTELLFFVGEAVRGTSPQIVFGLDAGGIDTAAESLAAGGVQLLTPVTEAPGGWSLEFKNPDEHPIAFFQDGSLPRRL
jgi:predicted enzyme related to lactoylglutathione lyase